MSARSRGSATGFSIASSPPKSARAERRRNRVPTYAKRFAAKEACAKALGTGFRAGVFFRDIGVVNLRTGQPTLALTGGAKVRLDALTPAGLTPKIDLALTDEWPLAQAIVIISARPAANDLTVT